MPTRAERKNELGYCEFCRRDRFFEKHFPPHKLGDEEMDEEEDGEENFVRICTGCGKVALELKPPRSQFAGIKAKK